MCSSRFLAVVAVGTALLLAGMGVTRSEPARGSEPARQFGVVGDAAAKAANGANQVSIADNAVDESRQAYKAPWPSSAWAGLTLLGGLLTIRWLRRRHQYE